MSKLWGRRIRLSIICDTRQFENIKLSTNEIQTQLDRIVIEQTGAESDTLKIKFDVNYPGIEGYYMSEIVVYNLKEEFADITILAGAILELEAGYKDSDTFGLIFKGYIYQVLWEKEDVINYKLTLVCVDGSALWTQQNFISTTLDKGLRYDTKMNLLLSKAIRDIPVTESIKDNQKYQPLPRSEVVHCQPSNIFDDTINQGGLELRNTAIFSEQGKIKFLDLEETSYEKEAIVVSPYNGGLIGTPQQTIYGANFCTLLNPNIKLKIPLCVIRLENTSFIQLRMNPGTTATGAKMQSTLEYLVIGVRHIGDTRSSTWYTYVTGCNKAGAIPPQLQPEQFRREE